VQRELVLELVSTGRHVDFDGVDVLQSPQWATAWVSSVSGLLPAGVASVQVGEDLRRQMVQLRWVVRSLFACAVRPGPPSPVDAHRLLSFEQALARLNAMAGRLAVRPRLHWVVESADPPRIELDPLSQEPTVQLEAALARASMCFLSGPLRAQLRACTAPRCVRYFVRSHGRQRWCCVSCGNRARAARHYRRHGPARV